MHCCTTWFKHVHDRIKEPNTTPTSTVASSQDTLTFRVFVLCEKKGERARPSPGSLSFDLHGFLFTGIAEIARAPDDA